MSSKTKRYIFKKMYKDKTIEISIVVLCYKADTSITDFLDKIILKGKQRGLNFEMILVANFWNNKEDTSPLMIKNYAKNKNYCKVISKVKKGDMGWDMKSGFEASSGEIIIVIDGDSQFESSLVFWVYDKLIDNNLDLCKTYRIQREDGIYRKFISKIFNLVFSLLFPAKQYKREFIDINSKPKAFTREAYNKMILTSNDWFIDAEIMINARDHTFRMSSFPICFYKSERESFVKPIAIIEFIKNLIYFRLKKVKH